MNAGPVLRVFLGKAELCSVEAMEVPVEKSPIVELGARTASLRFVSSESQETAFDLSSAVDQGARYFYMSVRVNPAYGVQADGILLEHRDDDPQQAYADGGKALRLQPFLLPEASGDPTDSQGRGLFKRGLHFAGTVSPSNLSLVCICDVCRESFRLQSFHAGFSDLVYLYCSGGPHTLTVSAYEPDAPPLLSAPEPSALARFEAQLPACEECGGKFRYLNPLRCPHCAAPYIDFPRHPEDRQREYYGNYLYGAQLQRHPAATQ